MPTLHATKAAVEVGAPKVQQCPHHWALDETSYGICNLCGDERQFDGGQQPSQDDLRSLAVPSTALAQTEQRLPAIESWDPFRPISTGILARIIQEIPQQKEAPNTLSQELLRFRQGAGKNRPLPPPLTEKELQAIVTQEEQKELPTLFVPALAPLRALPG